MAPQSSVRHGDSGNRVLSKRFGARLQVDRQAGANASMEERHSADLLTRSFARAPGVDVPKGDRA